MNEEIDESEFYHQDFTTASEWEIFIARMEEVIQEWKNESAKHNYSKANTQTTWDVKTEKIPFADVDFELLWYRKNTDSTEIEDKELKETLHRNPIDTTYDFTLQTEEDINSDLSVALWYGLTEFMLVRPLSKTSITSESHIKILLSSIHCVVSNVNCCIPMFVQIREQWQRCYLGVYENEGIRTNFDIVHLRRGPQHCQYLSGFLDLFKTKVISSGRSSVSLDPICISVQLTYSLTEFGNFIWKQDMPDVDNEGFDSTTLCTLPFGVTVDPVSCILLKATWSCLPDNLVVDTENYSDFTPLQAPKWSLLAKMLSKPRTLLGDCLSEFIHLNGNATVYDMLGDFAATPAPDVAHPLDLLTESKVPTISTVLKRAARSSLTKNRRDAAPLSEDLLVPMLYFLFPDADENAALPYSEQSKESGQHSSHSNDLGYIDVLCNGFKTCGVDSLVWRLAIVLAQALHNLGGGRAMAHLWYEFTQEMRYRWEKSIVLPGLPRGFPDPRTCLLHQKLQMLNCCIERKKARESSLSTSTFDSAEGSSDDDEVFFDCADTVGEEGTVKKKVKHSLWNQPVGRLGRFGDFKLLKTGEPFYIPITQDPVPKTEDQLEEDTEVLLKLGSDAQGSELRAKMMSASLLSDMESFKAANPGSVLEDFIRWYSPRDWVEDPGVDEWGQPKGHLSSRMLISNNTWIEVWESAKPVPANRQKRLFDDTREAEKILHFLDSRKMSQIGELVLPVLAHAAIYRLAQEGTVGLPTASATVRHLIKSVEQLSRSGNVSQYRYEEIAREVALLEESISQVNSLLYKFNPAGEHDEFVASFVADLVKGREREIENKADSKIGGRILYMFSEAQKTALMYLSDPNSIDGGVPAENSVFPRASERAFVLRVSAARPTACSAKSPQFLRAVLSKDEFRLAGAFSEDIVFF